MHSEAPRLSQLTRSTRAVHTPSPKNHAETINLSQLWKDGPTIQQQNIAPAPRTSSHRTFPSRQMVLLPGAGAKSSKTYNCVRNFRISNFRPVPFCVLL
ncbi:hypothetical protein ZHAS_00008293 [Anopheles sinensis]|uniref:Uncharacterized protein n=1 Tax=Anopheles sinensis TaxID=74873 RepID=A0A084VRT1_ANOSI|nr:hypothetical protein ZHAS_00008293 [Anopheles sinensis]